MTIAADDRADHVLKVIAVSFPSSLMDLACFRLAISQLLPTSHN